MILQIKTGSTCNFKCKYCCDAPNNLRKDTPFDLIGLQHIVDDLKSNNQEIEVYVVGGEPFLYKDIIPLIELLQKNEIPTSIQTNSFYLEKYYELLKKSPYVKVSISYHPDEYSINEIIKHQKYQGVINDIVIMISLENKDKSTRAYNIIKAVFNIPVFYSLIVFNFPIHNMYDFIPKHQLNPFLTHDEKVPVLDLLKKYGNTTPHEEFPIQNLCKIKSGTTYLFENKYYTCKTYMYQFPETGLEFKSFNYKLYNKEFLCEFKRCETFETPWSK